MAVIETFDVKSYHLQLKWGRKVLGEGPRIKMTRKRNTENEVVVSPAGAAPARRKSTARRSHAAVTERETPATPSVDAPLAEYEPTNAEISLQAYLYWEERGCQGGSSEEDWLRAEQELKARGPMTATA
jgi:hypothetical protein